MAQWIKNLPANAGDLASVTGLGGSPAEGNDSPLQDSCLEISMDKGAWWGPWGCKELDTTERLTVRAVLSSSFVICEGDIWWFFLISCFPCAWLLETPKNHHVNCFAWSLTH